MSDISFPDAIYWYRWFIIWPSTGLKIPSNRQSVRPIEIWSLTWRLRSECSRWGSLADSDFSPLLTLEFHLITWNISIHHSSIVIEVIWTQLVAMIDGSQPYSSFILQCIRWWRWCCPIVHCAINYREKINNDFNQPDRQMVTEIDGAHHKRNRCLLNQIQCIIWQWNHLIYFFFLCWWGNIYLWSR